MKYTNTLLFILLTILSSCSITKQSNSKEITPPNSIKIGANFYFDKTEISNIDWKEYLFWIKNIYGENSNEYRSALPNGINKVTDEIEGLSENETYFNSPEFSYHPLIGVSQAQAKAYSKWRSDRVFEAMLIQANIISINRNQTKDDHFTTTKYLNGEIKKLDQAKKLKYYPEFRLPSKLEWTKVASFNDSIYDDFNASCTNKKCRESLLSYPEIWIRTDEGSATRPVSESYLKRTYNLIYNLRGNVSEWLAEEGFSAGGSYRESSIQLKQDKFQETNHNPNQWTGFRNICTWIEIKNANENVKK